MNAIDQLIAAHSPDGVPFVNLGDVVRIRNGSDHKRLNDGDIPVYGSGGVMRHVDTAIAEGPSVLIPRKGSLGNIFYVDGPFWVVDTIFRTEIDETRLIPRFFYYQLLTMRLGEMNQAAGVPSQTQSALNRLRIPVPPLEVQQEIVRILDKFTQLEAELEAELEARQKQYAHYRDALFLELENAPLLPLRDLVSISHGFAFRSREYVSSGIRVIRISDVQKGTVSDKDIKYFPLARAQEVQRYLLKEDDLVMSLSGSVGRVAMLGVDHIPAALNQRVACLRATSRKVTVRYLFHYLNRDGFEAEAVSSTSGGTVKNLSSRWLQEVRVPVPDLKTQASIVTLLDKFDALVNDLSSGLPAEIAARRKQYEFYRDRLLSFEELSA